MDSSPSPDWVYKCGESGNACKIDDGSMKQIRVFTDKQGEEKVVSIPTSRTSIVILNTSTGAEVLYSGDGTNGIFANDGTASDIEVEKDSEGKFYNLGLAQACKMNNFA